MRLFPHVFVNGYGATPDVTDENYARYLGELVRLLSLPENADRCFTVYLCGGNTNRMDLTEAQCMASILEYLGRPRNANVCLVECSTTCRDNLLQVHQLVGNVPLTAFCEYSRRTTVDYLAKRLFREVMVVPVAFDYRSLAIGHQLKQRFLKYPLEVAAYWSPAFDAVRVILRERHVAKCRAAENLKPSAA